MKKILLLSAISLCILSCNNSGDAKTTNADSAKIKDSAAKDSTNPATQPVQNAPY